MKLGLVCISEILKEEEKENKKKYKIVRSGSFKTMTRTKFLKTERFVAKKMLGDIILHNCSVLARVITHCNMMGIRHYRVSSTLMPLISDASLGLTLESLYNYYEILLAMDNAASIAKNCGISLSMHPDQYCVLASYNPEVVARSINELNHQAMILDLLGCPQSLAAPMCLHLNASPNLSKETVSEYKDRFFKNLSRCDRGVVSRLVLENEDKGTWNCQTLHSFFGSDIALVYDNLHDTCNPSDPTFDWPDLFAKTWGQYRPVFHWSEGIDGGRSHTDYASHIPDVVTRLAETVTWEVELKAKDKAIMNIFKNINLNK